MKGSHGQQKVKACKGGVEKDKKFKIPKKRMTRVGGEGEEQKESEKRKKQEKKKE